MDIGHYHNTTHHAFTDSIPPVDYWVVASVTREVSPGSDIAIRVVRLAKTATAWKPTRSIEVSHPPPIPVRSHLPAAQPGRPESALPHNRDIL